MRRLLARRNVQITLGVGLLIAGCAELSPIQWEEMKADLWQKDRRARELEDAISRREQFLGRAQASVQVQERRYDELRATTKKLDGEITVQKNEVAALDVTNKALATAVDGRRAESDKLNGENAALAAQVQKATADRDALA
ncbi:MAG: hypothetical protein ACAI25_03915, partial [Planctomycetota bacterium]